MAGGDRPYASGGCGVGGPGGSSPTIYQVRDVLGARGGGVRIDDGLSCWPLR
jgi:hypothetical protein